MDLITVLVGVKEEGAVELGNPLAPDLHWDLVPHLIVESEKSLLITDLYGFPLVSVCNR